MTKVPAVFPPLLLFIAFAFTVQPAAADPIQVTLTSGLVFSAVGPGLPGHPEDLRLFGPGFSINSSLEDETAFFRLTSPPAVGPRAAVDFSGVVRVEDLAGFEPFEISFHALQPARLTCSETGVLLTCFGRAPFTLDGELASTPFGGTRTTFHITGRGIAQGEVSRLRSDVFAAVHYNIGAVPEPATLILFATGAALGSGQWRRRCSHACRGYGY